MAKKRNKTKTKNSSKSSIWDTPAKVGKLVRENPIKVKASLGVGSYLAQKIMDRMNGTSSLYYDPTTGEYIDASDMHPIWQKNLAKNDWVYDKLYTVFNKWPKKLGEGISDLAGVDDPETRELISTVTDGLSYLTRYYGLLKGSYDVGNQAINSVLDTNRDIDMIKDLRYGDMGYSIKYLEDNELAPIWEGAKTVLANDWVHDLTGIGRRTGFSEQSDVYKLGQQTTIKMMQKMLEDTGNFDPANAKSRVTLNQFNMMNQLLKNSDAYWQLQSIKNSQDMNDDDFYAYLDTAGIDENTYKDMEYAAKQLYNLGDNQERNGLRYDPKFNFSTNTPMIQYAYARKQKPIQNDPLAGLVGGSNVLDGYTKVGDNFVDIKTGEKLVPEIDSENQNTPTPTITPTATTQEATTTTPATATDNDTKENTVNTVQDTPNYVKAGFYEFPQEYARRTGYNFANNPYNIWK